MKRIDEKIWNHDVGYVDRKIEINIIVFIIIIIIYYIINTHTYIHIHKKLHYRWFFSHVRYEKWINFVENRIYDVKSM